MPLPSSKRVAVVGREKQTINYRKALSFFRIEHDVVLSIGSLSSFDALLLPGGGDIDPYLLNEPNKGSKDIDTELDIFQFQALDFFVKNKKPVLGICKGFQLIEAYFGGKLIQDLPLPSLHPTDKNGNDSFHPVFTKTSFAETPPRFFKELPFPKEFLVNSAHHQGIGQNGKSLYAFQTAPDGITEAICHDVLPIVAFQWHPERLLFSADKSLQKAGMTAFHLFLSLL